MLAAGNASLHEPGALEDFDMLGNPIEGHREPASQLTYGRGAADEEAEDGSPRRVGDGGVDVVERRVPRHPFGLCSTGWLNIVRILTL